MNKLFAMIQNPHLFHIPVMGTGHTIVTPIRVSHLGIHSVLSVVDDMLCERIRKYYSGKFGLEYKSIPKSAEDGRARRITAYLDMVADIASRKFEELKALPLFQNTEKDRYFQLLPEGSTLREYYEKAASLTDPRAREELIGKLTKKMLPGSVDVNIMAKVDLLASDKQGVPLSGEFSDANAALRGFAKSKLNSSLVLSAGFNPRLYNYISEFRDFYRDHKGEIKKKIILKVSDFRSALIQGKFLAKKGVEVAEFRIESGLNCGGHAFVSGGDLLPVLLQEFREKRELLAESFEPLIKNYYHSQGWHYSEEHQQPPRITVQGGIGNNGEMSRLLETYKMDGTGWGSPFLLVPEATCVDSETATLLAEAEEKDLYLSNVSPLGVPFNNVRSDSEEHQQPPRITVQGGIGNNGEMSRLLETYKMDGTGWGSPFLLVPEATCVDSETATLLAEAEEKDLYLSNVSPLGVPFNNVRGSGSYKHTVERIDKGKPGSPCPKGYLKSNTEFTEEPICTASSHYQLLKIDQIEKSDYTSEKKKSLINGVLDKECLCTNLGAGSLIRLGILKPDYGRQAICPGPNIAWFNREYSLEEMTDHIYGRGESLVPEERPHMFAKEITMYVDYLSERSILADHGTPEWRSLVKMKRNLEKGMTLCLEIAESEPYPGENLDSIRTTVTRQRARLEEMFEIVV